MSLRKGSESVLLILLYESKLFLIIFIDGNRIENVS